MTKQYPVCLCNRQIIQEGLRNRLEAALDSQGLPAVLEELETLLTSSELEVRQRTTDLSVVLELFCDRPENLRRNELNWLYEEIWELKFGVMRLAFTSANCIHADKNRVLRLAGHVVKPAPDTNTARATSLFVKNDDAAPRSEIRRARAIAREDRLR